MKAKTLIPLSLVVMSSVFADYYDYDDNYYQDQGCCPQPCCEPVCCKPCCVPEPRKCIDCECYNPQYYILQCNWGFFASAEFLYWYAHETNLDYAALNQYSINPVVPTVPGFLPFSLQGQTYPTDHFYVKSNWDPGVRVGLGWNSACNGFDLYLNWTYFHNDAKSSQSRPIVAPDSQSRAGTVSLNGRQGLFNPWAPLPLTDSASFPIPAVTDISGKWSITFNQIDLEFGLKYWVTRCFNIRPYMGVRGAWTKTQFKVEATDNDPTVTIFAQDVGFFLSRGPTFTATTNNFRNKYWGVGLMGGLQPEFMLGNWCGCGNWSIYGNAEGAVLWGKFSGRNSYNVFASRNLLVTQTDQNTIDVNFLTVANPVGRDRFMRMQGILDAGLGIRWQQYWCSDRFSTAIDLGWEHHYWFDFGLYHRTYSGNQNFLDGTPTDFIVTYFQDSDNYITNLGFGGLVIRARFDF